MKSTELKKMIKEAVKEAIHEELKEILLEAVRSPKGSSVAVMQEATTPTQPQPQPMGAAERKSLYEQALGETTLSFNSQQAPSFQPQPGYDSTNGTLPQGSVGMDQIMGLINKK